MQFCEDQGMVINELKTKFMIINHEELDKADIIVRPEMTIKYTNKYVYLGAAVTDDGNMCTVMREHAAMKNAHYLKFAAFVKKNVHAPFYVKRQVFRACILSTLLYSCEVWCVTCVDKSIRKIYLSCIRSILGIRTSTDIDLCLHEIMMPSIEALVYDIQRKYLVKVTSNADHHALLCRIMEMGRNVQLASGHVTRCKVVKYIDKVLASNDKQRITEDIDERRERIAVSTKTKTLLYKQWSPTLSVHDVYVTRKYFPEHWRIAWTRFRLGSTNLPCEKGRWMPGNTKEMICICGETQTEDHILSECEERVVTGCTAEELFTGEDQRNAMKEIFDTLQKYEKG